MIFSRFVAGGFKGESALKFWLLLYLVARRIFGPNKCRTVRPFFGKVSQSTNPPTPSPRLLPLGQYQQSS